MVVASDAVEAIRLQRRRYDIVFMDWSMPGISGWEVATSAKRLHKDMPEIVVTGWTAGIDNVEAYRRGADGIVYKPFDMEDLVAAMTRHTR